MNLVSYYSSDEDESSSIDEINDKKRKINEKNDKLNEDHGSYPKYYKTEDIVDENKKLELPSFFDDDNEKKKRKI